MFRQMLDWPTPKPTFATVSSWPRAGVDISRHTLCGGQGVAHPRTTSVGSERSPARLEVSDFCDGRIQAERLFHRDKSNVRGVIRCPASERPALIFTIVDGSQYRESPIQDGRGRQSCDARTLVERPSVNRESFLHALTQGLGCCCLRHCLCALLEPPESQFSLLLLALRIAYVDLHPLLVDCRIMLAAQPQPRSSGRGGALRPSRSLRHPIPSPQRCS